MWYIKKWIIIYIFKLLKNFILFEFKYEYYIFFSFPLLHSILDLSILVTDLNIFHFPM